MLAILLALTATTPGDPPPGLVLNPPPWAGAPDETRIADSRAFQPCDQMFRAASGEPDRRVVEPRYAHSRHWGWIARAKLVFGDEPGAIHITCWSRSGRHFQFVSAPERFLPGAADPTAPPGQPHYRVDILTPPPPPPR